MKHNLIRLIRLRNIGLIIADWLRRMPAEGYLLQITQYTKAGISLTLITTFIWQVLIIPTLLDGPSGDRSKIRNGDRSEFSFENVPKILRPVAAGEREKEEGLRDDYKRRIGDPSSYASHILPLLSSKTNEPTLIKAWHAVCIELIEDYMTEIVGGHPSYYIESVLAPLVSVVDDIEAFRQPVFYIPVKLQTTKYDQYQARNIDIVNMGALNTEIKEGRIIKIDGEYYFPMKNPLRPAGTRHNRSLPRRRDKDIRVYKGTGASDRFYNGGLIFNIRKYEADHLLDGGLPRSESCIEVAKLLRQTFNHLKEEGDPNVLRAIEYGADIDMFIDPICEASPLALPVIITNGELSPNARDLLRKSISSPASLSIPDSVKLVPTEGFLDFIGISKQALVDPVIYVYSVPVNLRLEEIKNLKDMEQIFNYYGYRVTYRENGSIDSVTKDGVLVEYQKAAEEVLLSASSRFALLIYILHNYLDGCARSRDDNVFTIFTQHNVNPISLFDYDNIRLNIDKRKKMAAYNRDKSDAKRRLLEIAHILGVSKDRALLICDKKFNEVLGESRYALSAVASLGDQSKKRFLQRLIGIFDAQVARGISPAEAIAAVRHALLSISEHDENADIAQNSKIFRELIRHLEDNRLLSADDASKMSTLQGSGREELEGSILRPRAAGERG